MIIESVCIIIGLFILFGSSHYFGKYEDMDGQYQAK
jgi:hypothetical protein